MRTIVGVDPGKAGALFFMFADHHKEVLDMPETAQELANVLSAVASTSAMVFVEQVASRPGQGAVSTFTFGKQYGELLGILVALKIPHELLRPQRWQKLVGIPSGSDKLAHIVKAQQLFPGIEFTGPRGGGLDGRADASLIAEAGKRILGGKEA